MIGSAATMAFSSALRAAVGAGDPARILSRKRNLSAAIFASEIVTVDLGPDASGCYASTDPSHTTPKDGTAWATRQTFTRRSSRRSLSELLDSAGSIAIRALGPRCSQSRTSRE
jgi:hypothetical protein